METPQCLAMQLSPHPTYCLHISYEIAEKKIPETKFAEKKHHKRCFEGKKHWEVCSDLNTFAFLLRLS
jgi:hypothetical protein